MPRTFGPPDLMGDASGFAYDWPQRRWLPVAWTSISSDGSRYWYSASPGVGNNTTGQEQLYEVDVASGSARVVASARMTPLGSDSGKEYFVEWRGGMGGSGLYALDLTSSALSTVYPSGRSANWRFVADGFVYGGDFNPQDTNQPGSGEVPDEVIRLDLSTGQSVHLVYHAGVWAEMLGLSPMGHVIVTEVGPGGPGSPSILNTDGSLQPVTGLPPRVDVLFSGGDQTWFRGDGNLYKMRGSETAVLVMSNPRDGGQNFGSPCG